MAEIFGTELVKGKSYTFHTGAKVAVFTWQGCTIELKGRKNISYIARETPMVSRLFYMHTTELFLKQNILRVQAVLKCK